MKYVYWVRFIQQEVSGWGVRSFRRYGIEVCWAGSIRQIWFLKRVF